MKSDPGDFYVGIWLGILLSCLVPFGFLLLYLVVEPITAFAPHDFVVFGAIMLIFSIFLIIFIPKLQLTTVMRPSGRAMSVRLRRNEIISLENEIRKTVIQIIGGTFVLFGFYFSYAAYQLNSKNQASEQYIKALDYLKSADTGEIGVALLHKYVDEYPDEGPNALSALCDFVRSKSPNLPPMGKESAEVPDSISIAVSEIVAIKEKTTSRKLRAKTWNPVQIRLTKANLHGLDLRDFDLAFVDFTGSDLSGANLSGSILYKAEFSRCNLSGVNLSGANLSSADLTDAIFNGANLSESNLLYANLSGGEQHGLTAQLLQTAILDESTILSAFFDKDRRDLIEASRKVFVNVLKRVTGRGPETTRMELEKRGLDSFRGRWDDEAVREFNNDKFR